MAYEKSNLIIGAVFYITGILAVNFFLKDFSPAFSFHPSVELLVVCAGLLAMSMFFYSRFSYILLFAVGIFFGSLASEKPLFVGLAFIPLTFAHWLGIEMGFAARQDFFGKTNFFAEKEKYIIFTLILLALALIAGVIPEYVVFKLPFAAIK